MAATYPLSLAALKLNLGLRSPDTDQSGYLAGLLDAAASELSAAGITVNENLPAVRNLLVIYASWLYRSRATGAEKPPMLSRLINNAIIREGRYDIR